jgi:transposase
MDELHAMEAGFRSLGEGKDSRPELPQVIVGMAVIRDGIPVRCWCWPGKPAIPR